MDGYTIWLLVIGLSVLNIFAHFWLQKSALPQNRKQFINIGIGLLLGVILSLAFRLNLAYAIPAILLVTWLEFYTFNLIASTANQRQ